MNHVGRLGGVCGSPANRASGGVVSQCGMPQKERQGVSLCWIRISRVVPRALDARLRPETCTNPSYRSCNQCESRRSVQQPCSALPLAWFIRFQFQARAMRIIMERSDIVEAGRQGVSMGSDPWKKAQMGISRRRRWDVLHRKGHCRIVRIPQESLST